MNSLTTERFWKCYYSLSEEIQQRAQIAYSFFLKNHNHPSLRFKKVLDDPDVYSVRISQSYRALGVREGATIIWFWIGSHDEYESLIRNMF